MNDWIDADDIGIAIQEALEEYNEEVVKDLKKITLQAAQDLVKNTKADAPVGDHRAKHFRDYIAQKKVSDTKFGVEHMWYVRSPEHALTHLLEKGHATRNGGRVAGHHFIQNNIDRLEPWYLEKIKEALQKHG